MFEKKNILGVGVTNATQEEILEYIVNFVKNSSKKLFITTPNPEILVFAHHHHGFKTILNKADLALNDGAGVTWASTLLKKPLKARVTGVDVMEKLCEKVCDRPITVGFLGGRIGVAERTAECLQKKYSHLKVSFAGEEWSETLCVIATPSGVEGETISLNGIASSGLTSLTIPRNDNRKEIDILFVAFGFPKQEQWIYDNLERIPVKVAMGVGGAFDYISGRVPRAPRWVRSIGFEWLFRLLIEPWRIKRQLVLLEFVWLVIKEKLSPK